MFARSGARVPRDRLFPLLGGRGGLEPRRDALEQHARGHTPADAVGAAGDQRGRAVAEREVQQRHELLRRRTREDAHAGFVAAGEV